MAFHVLVIPCTTCCMQYQNFLNREMRKNGRMSSEQRKTGQQHAFAKAQDRGIHEVGCKRATHQPHLSDRSRLQARCEVFPMSAASHQPHHPSGWRDSKLKLAASNQKMTELTRDLRMRCPRRPKSGDPLTTCEAHPANAANGRPKTARLRFSNREVDGPMVPASNILLRYYKFALGRHRKSLLM